MQQTRIDGFRPIYVARFLAVSRICLFINFANFTYIQVATKNIQKPANLLNNSYSLFIGVS